MPDGRGQRCENLKKSGINDMSRHVDVLYRLEQSFLTQATMKLLIAFLFANIVSVSKSASLEGCSQTKQCFRFPENCSLTSSDCSFFSFAWNPTSKTYKMELSGGIGNGKSYSAVAFSRTPQMSNADLYYCTGNDLKSGALQFQYAPPVTRGVEAQVSNVSATTVNGVADCSFIRPANVIKTTSVPNEEFDLTTTDFFILFARGSTRTLSNSVFPLYHGRDNRRSTPSKVNFAPPQQPDITDGCEISKSCHSNMGGCTVETDASCIFVTWAYDSTSNSFEIEFAGAVSGDSEYIAIAFASSPMMKDADLYYCDGSTIVSGTIRGRHMTPVVDDPSPGFITNAMSTTINGSRRCSFTREADITKVVSGQMPMAFDLSSTEFHLLMARGPIVNGAFQFHGPNNRWASGMPIDFVADHCDPKKQCHTNADCSIGDDGCIFTAFSYDESKMQFDIELRGKVGSSNYIAFAFAPAPMMQDADVYFCTSSTAGTAVIAQFHTCPKVDSTSPNGVTSTFASVTDGVAVCRFTRPASVERTVSSGNMTFDISTTSFYFLYATAVYVLGSLPAHARNARWVSDEAISLVDLILAPQTSVMALPDITDGCEISKSCYSNMGGCTAETDASCIFVTWAYDSTSNSFEIEFAGAVSGDSEYIAIAFASSPMMKDADLYYCDGSTIVSGTIRGRHMTPVVDDPSPEFITNAMSTTINGTRRCLFTRDADITKVVSGQMPMAFDLSSTEFHLLMARGPIVNGAFQFHGPNNRWASGMPIDFVAGHCGPKKQCHTNDACSIGDDGCIFTAFSYDESKMQFDIELRGKVGSSNYIAFAFAPAPMMQDADVYFCTSSTAGTAVIAQFHTCPKVDSTSPNGVTSTFASVTDGVAVCRFTRPASVERTVSSGNMTFDISTTSYYFLYATAGYVPGSLPAHARNARWVSDEAISLMDLISAPQTSVMALPDITDGCEISKSCYSNMGGCTAETDASCIFVTWAYDSTSNSFEIEFAGAVSGESEYIAIAFASSPIMKDADLYYCDGSTIVSGTIRGRHMTPVVDDPSPGYITNAMSTTINGTRRCLFTRDADITKVVSGQMPMAFDLSSTEFHLLMARGPIVNGAFQFHGPNNRWASGMPIDFVAGHCGPKKQCHTNDDCSIGDDGCIFTAFSYDESKMQFDIELRGKVGSSNYIAFAFAPAPMMQDADVCFCTSSTAGTAVIAQFHTCPKVDSTSPNGVTSTFASVTDGVAVCRFTRPASVERTVSSGNMTFDISTTSYYFLYATAGYVSGSLPAHASNARWVSDEAISLMDLIPAPAVIPAVAGCQKSSQQNTPSCSTSTDSNCISVTWCYNQATQSFDFEMSGTVGTTSYIAFAFASSNQMKDADLYFCTGSVFGTGTIRKHHSPPTVDNAIPASITNAESNLNSSVATCTFTRAASLQRNITNGMMTFDLSSTDFYILFAKGSYAGGSLMYHSTNRWATSGKIDFTP